MGSEPPCVRACMLAAKRGDGRVFSDHGEWRVCTHGKASSARCPCRLHGQCSLCAQRAVATVGALVFYDEVLRVGITGNGDLGERFEPVFLCIDGCAPMLASLEALRPWYCRCQGSL